MPDEPTPPPTPTRSLQDIEAERAAIGGPTLFANRWIVQFYPDDVFRIIFMEQYTSDTNVAPAYRTAVLLQHPENLIETLQRAIADARAKFHPQQPQTASEE
jgi:hypothetical protein